MQRDTQIQVVLGDPDAPKAASGRKYLRGSMPSVYLESPGGRQGEAFVMRFLESLELVLDPIVATLDQLPAYLDIDLAPPEVVALIGEWFGIELDAALPIGVHRRLLKHLSDITMKRGTKPGIEQLLQLAFPGLALEVRDGGRATAGSDSDAEPLRGDESLVVTCPPRVHPDDLRAIRRVVEEVAPAHVRFELRTYEGELA